MAHNIDMSNSRANIAFTGSRQDIWHSLGQEMKPGMSIEEWAKAAGLDWRVEKVPAFADVPGRGMVEVDGARHIVRMDTGHPLGYVSDRYQPVQPSELLGWFGEYIGVDDRFQLDVAGSLKKGEIIWATATFNSDLSIAGDQHRARLLMTTTFDGTGSTINKGTMTRVVCNNTLDAALGEDRRAVIKTRHNTKFNAEKVGQELATIAQSFDAYKTIGDAMGRVHLSKEQIATFFKSILDIPFDAKKEDISTRKLNQFDELVQAYGKTAHETDPGTAWCALNAVTRYVDHDRSTRSSNGDRTEARFLSSQFGSGALMKDKAVSVLCEMSDIDLLKAVSARTAETGDVSAILKQPLVASVGN
jgi:phage/plasmid-like protein (TIGR03299 family)